MPFNPTELSTAIKEKSVISTAPDGTPQDTLTVADSGKLAARFGITIKAVEMAALTNHILPLRYQRNEKTLGVTELSRLLHARAAIIGLGGLGGTVTELLARANVGHLVLVDGDVFEDHNLNRQLLCTEDRLGTSKAKAAADRVKAVNSAITVEYFDTPIDEHNRFDLVSGNQVVIDCLDNIPARFLVQETARQAGIPFVSAAVAGLAGHVTTIFPEDKGLELIFGSREHAVQHPKGIETVLGCLPQAVSLIAAIESAEAIKVLLGYADHLLRNRLLLVDLSRNSFDTLVLCEPDDQGDGLSIS